MSKGSVYLAGPISGVSYGGATSWRDEATAALAEAGIDSFSPLRWKNYLSGETAIAPEYENITLSSSRGLTTRDRWDCSRVDVVLAYMLGAKNVSIGTMIEFGWADAARIPIIAVMEREGNLHEHPIVRECIGFRVETLEEGLHVAMALLLPNWTQPPTYLKEGT